MLPSRLPDPIPPARHEITASYISRLATLHGLDISTLWTQTTTREPSGGMRRIIVPERLAALTGRTVHALAGALPELRDPPPDWAMFRHQPQPGCRYCDAKHPGGEVTRILPHHRYVCTRHQIWICPSDADGHTTRLDALPEIVQAQRRHLRILRRHGWAITYDAVLTAMLICGQLWSLPENENGEARHDPTRHSRSDLLRRTSLRRGLSRSRRTGPALRIALLETASAGDDLEPPPLQRRDRPPATTPQLQPQRPRQRSHQPLGQHDRQAPAACSHPCPRPGTSPSQASPAHRHPARAATAGPRLRPIPSSWRGPRCTPPPRHRLPARLAPNTETRSPPRRKQQLPALTGP